MSEYQVFLRADVMTEWTGEANSAEEACRLAIDDIDQLPYEVDFEVESVFEVGDGS